MKDSLVPVQMVHDRDATIVELKTDLYGYVLAVAERDAEIADLRDNLQIKQGALSESRRQVAERDAEIAALRQQVASITSEFRTAVEIWSKRDSDLRQQVAELQATVAAVKRKAQKFGDIADDWQKLANEKPEDSPKSGGFARISSVYAVCAAELREVIGIE